MSTRLQALLGATAKQRRLRAGVLLAAVIAVPLAVAGLVSGALGGADDRLESIPAIVVNDDEMVTSTLPDGTEQPVLAGRLLVTELTGDGATGFDWSISNDEEAAAKLASGEAYAVLTIPADFSSSITSISGADPTKAELSIRTDDAHGYLAGSVAQSVGDAMTSAFGREITAQYLEGFYANLAGVGGSLGDAADGAAQLSSGVDELSAGLGDLSGGVEQAAGGATDAATGAGAYAAGVRRYAAGVDSYTTGVDGIASGLGALNTGAAGLDAVSDGWDQYTDGITAGVDGAESVLGPAADGLDEWIAANPELAAQYPEIGQAAAQVAGVRAQLGALSAGGQTLAEVSRSAIDQTQDGIGGLAGGAAQLAGGSAGLRTGAADLASGADGLAGGIGELAGGLDQLATGAADASSGASQLADGAGELASGLGTGAEQASALTDLDAEQTADVVAEPVVVDTQRDHAIGSVGEVIGMLFAPIGLWLGALAMFLAFRPFGREALRSTASTGGLVWRTLARAGLVALGQTVAIVALMHTAMGASWSLMPQTLAFSALLALVFTAVHAFLTVWLGRGAAIVSIVLVALQITVTGGLFPVEVLSGPYQVLSPLLPLTWAVAGMQAIVAGAGASAIAGAAAVLAVFGVAGVLLTGLVVGRRRGIRSIGFAATALG